MSPSRRSLPATLAALAALLLTLLAADPAHALTIAPPSPTSDPHFRALFPYAVLSGLLSCDSTGTPLLTPASWRGCATCAALKITVPRVVVSNVAAPVVGAETSVFKRVRVAAAWNETTRTAVVAFGGTDEVGRVAEILGRRKWSPVTINGTGVQVNQGLRFAYQSIEVQANRLLRGVLEACPACDTVAFAGHSIGGALATLAAFEHATRRSLGGRKIRLYTFGSPMVGNEEFWKTLKETGEVVGSVRFVNGQDAVPLAPGGRSYTQGEGFVYWPRGSAELLKCFGNDTTAAGSCQRGVSVVNIEDHVMFGPFYQVRRLGDFDLTSLKDQRICHSDYSEILNSIPYHQALPTPCPSPILTPAPPNGTDLQDPVFRKLLPYSVSAATLYCDPARTTGTPALWAGCATCRALPWAPFRLVRVAFNGSRIASTAPNLEEVFADGAWRNFSGLMAGVSWNKAARKAMVVFRGTVGYDNAAYVTLK
ncbi:hypothetical protein HDU96_008758 [Phlyctochytrium bullatum]|nr:hypothetical protein HDU96_008758 [Phlyctochytrium bullatum]